MPIFIAALCETFSFEGVLFRLRRIAEGNIIIGADQKGQPFFFAEKGLKCNFNYHIKITWLK